MPAQIFRAFTGACLIALFAGPSFSQQSVQTAIERMQEPGPEALALAKRAGV